MTPKRGYMGVAVKEMRLISERDVDFVETETIVMFEEKKAQVNNRAEMGLVAEHDDGKRTYTVEEIQNILEIGRATAYRLIKKEYFKCVKIGGHIRISRKSFDAWLDGQP